MEQSEAKIGQLRLSEEEMMDIVVEKNVLVRLNLLVVRKN
jgi:hypothetical protein